LIFPIGWAFRFVLLFLLLDLTAFTPFSFPLYGAASFAFTLVYLVLAIGGNLL
jgi:hypothetical protein